MTRSSWIRSFHLRSRRSSSDSSRSSRALSLMPVTYPRRAGSNPSAAGGLDRVAAALEQRVVEVTPVAVRGERGEVDGEREDEQREGAECEVTGLAGRGVHASSVEEERVRASDAGWRGGEPAVAVWSSPAATARGPPRPRRPGARRAAARRAAAWSGV